jgi:hypothetical protein
LSAERWHRSGKRHRDQAGAKQEKTGNGHGKETIGSEFVTHGTPPIVRECWYRLDFRVPQQNDCPFAQSKGFPAGGPISIRVDVFMQHPEGARY